MNSTAKPSPSRSPLVGAPLVPTLARLAVPGVTGALIQTGLPAIEAWYLSQSGTLALAAVALVFPMIMLANMISTGAIGGAITGAIARALGAGDPQRAAAILRSAVVIALAGGALMACLLLVFSQELLNVVGASPEVRDTALAYAKIAFLGLPMLWLFNMLGSVLRGTGDMVSPAIGMTVNVFSYAVLGYLLIPAGDVPAAEVMHAAGTALVIAYCIGLLVMIALLMRPGQPVRLRGGWPRLDVSLQILKPGLLAASQSVMTVLYALVATALFGNFGIDWLAGYGLAVRLELLMIPVIFGIGASLIAIVGAHAGAGLRERAISIAWRGTAINVLIVGAVGLGLALAPQLWCDQVASTLNVAGNCQTTLSTLGPFYAFFALGMGLYFASQGLNTLKIPVTGTLLRLLVVASGLLWVNADSSPVTVLLMIGGAMLIYGLFIATGLRFFAWRPNLASPEKDYA